MKKFKNISVELFKKKFHDGAKVIDIRDKESFALDNIPNSENYNSSDLLKLVDSKKKNDNIIVVCYHGVSSQKVASFLIECGFKKVYNLIGGFSEWREKNR